MLFQVVGDAADGHPVHARTPLIGLYPPPCFFQVFSLTYFLHPSIRAGWVFGPIPLAGLMNRIRVEEAALAAALGPAYMMYASTRKRLIPFVW